MLKILSILPILYDSGDAAQHEMAMKKSEELYNRKQGVIDVIINKMDELAIGLEQFIARYLELKLKERQK